MSAASSRNTGPDVSPASTTEARSLVAVALQPELARLRQLRLGHRLKDLAAFLGLWLLGGAVALGGVSWSEPAFLRLAGALLGVAISAIALNAFVLLLHEGMHHTLLPSPFWNRWVSVLLGAPLLISFTAYQIMHLRHHQYLGDPRDPDDYQNYTRDPSRLWKMHWGRLLFGAFLYLLFIPWLAWRHGSARERWRLLEEYGLMAVLWVVVATTVPGQALVWGWGLPVILVGYMTNLRGFAQHGITDAHDPFLASRTVRPHRIVELCLLNENYHLEHHLFPEVPSYHLPELHRLMDPLLPRRVITSSYLFFLWQFIGASSEVHAKPIGLQVREHQGRR